MRPYTQSQNWDFMVPSLCSACVRVFELAGRPTRFTSAFASPNIAPARQPDRGGRDLTITDTSTDDSAFSVTIAGGLPATIKPEDEAQVAVVFAPDTDGVFSSELLVASDDPDTPTLIVALTGEGIVLPGELTVEVVTNSNALQFGDTLRLDLSILNTSETVTVDIYLVLTYDLGRPDERHWSASLTENLWIEGTSPLATGFAIDTGYELDYQWWTSTLPSKLPMISKSGTYTFRMAAFAAGTLDFASNLATSEFLLTGEPFVDVTTDKVTYSMDCDTVTISLDVDVPYDLTADAYILVLSPDGQFWSPTGFGETSWAAGIAPTIPSITLGGGFVFSGPAFTAILPAGAPFDTPGQFTLFAALVEPGTLTPLSDIGTATFALQGAHSLTL